MQVSQVSKGAKLDMITNLGQFNSLAIEEFNQPLTRPGFVLLAVNLHAEHPQASSPATRRSSPE